jgi:hypothetical protein
MMKKFLLNPLKLSMTQGWIFISFIIIKYYPAVLILFPFIQINVEFKDAEEVPPKSSEIKHDSEVNIYVFYNYYILSGCNNFIILHI